MSKPKIDELLVKATKVGAFAASLEDVDGEERGTNDALHHLGDDTGD